MDQVQHQNFIVKAVDLTHDGLGVTRLEDGYIVFVDDMLKGEVARIEVTERRKKFGFGKVLELLQKSPFRLVPKCKHYAECGGCRLMHMDYDVQIQFKKSRLKLMMKKLNQDPDLVEDIICMVNPYYYRNKVEIKFSQGPEGIKAGFFRAKSHHVIDLQECYTMSKKSFELLTLLKNICNELDIKAYDPQTQTGDLKSCVIRESSKNKEIVFLLHTARDTFENEDRFIDKVIENYPMVKGIGAVKTLDESTFSPDEIRVLYGKDYLTEEILGVKFEIGFRSFFQVNTVQTERLFKTAIDYADLKDTDKVIDAYCGIGAISLSLAKDVFKVFGIEVVKPAIIDAKKNAVLNGITNAFFEVGNAEQVIQKWKKYSFDCIFIDPPRKGCNKVFIQTLINMKIPKIVYISCNPATLARDLDALTKNGYSIQSVTPVDMFPQTHHVESCTLLELK